MWAPSKREKRSKAPTAGISRSGVKKKERPDRVDWPEETDGSSTQTHTHTRIESTVASRNGRTDSNSIVTKIIARSKRASARARELVRSPPRQRAPASPRNRADRTVQAIPGTVCNRRPPDNEKLGAASPTRRTATKQTTSYSSLLRCAAKVFFSFVFFFIIF